MTRTMKLLSLVLIAATLVVASGCMRVELDLGVAPNGATNARVAMGMGAELAAMGEQEAPFGELMKGASNWKTREYKDGQWMMTEAVGSAAAGEKLFPEEEAPQMTVAIAKRRLSTRYNVAMNLSNLPEMQKPQAIDEEGDAQTQALVKSMMASFKFTISLQGPGRVIATTGKVTGPGKAQWSPGFDQITDKAALDFRVVTELPNYANIGRLADQLAYSGRRYDAAGPLAEALNRGLLPNPPVNTDASDKLKPEDYALLLEIIAKLDAGGRPSVTEAVIGKLNLNADEASAAAIKAAHAKIMKLNVSGLAEQSLTKALLADVK